MLNTKKSQAALEFLMTYGWAILIVLIVISALAYFGVLNPQNLLPSKCTLPAGWSCTDYLVKGDPAGTAGSLKIKILNGMGTGLTITNFTFTPDTATQGNVCNGTVATYLANAGSVSIQTNSAACGINSNLATGSKYRWKMAITYWPDGSDVTYAKTIQGELFTSVEK